jgi:hypothetical protein
MSARSKITNALVEALKTIDGSATWQSNLFGNVENRLKFWDEVDDYPSVYVNTGYEMRDYQPGGFKWAYLSITIRVYVQDEEPEARLEEIFEDIEKIVDNNGNMVYDTNETIEDMKILSINTDEGLLNPIGVGEVVLQIQYDLGGPCY